MKKIKCKLLTSEDLKNPELDSKLYEDLLRMNYVNNINYKHSSFNYPVIHFFRNNKLMFRILPEDEYYQINFNHRSKNKLLLLNAKRLEEALFRMIFNSGKKWR